MIHRTKTRHHKILLAVILAAIAITFLASPEFYIRTLAEADFSIIILVLCYLPAFFILMGVIEVWLPEKFVVRHLGKHSGIKGSFYSFLLGSLIPGPLYIAFPLSAVLLRKGVSMFNAALFLGAWSSFKIGEEIFEIQFLGMRFLLLRVAISIPFIVIMSLIISRVHFKKFEKRNA